MERSPHATKILIGAAVALVVVIAVVLIAQSGGDDGGSSGDSAAISTDTSQKPEVPVPEGEPPTGLESTDIVEGDGAVAETGDTVEVQYVGVDYSTGEQFDASWDNGQPFTFQLGSGQVIPGWDQGITGMKVGGRRELIIPPDLAYGAQGSPPAIGPDATLVFVVDLLDVEDGGATNGGNG